LRVNEEVFKYLEEMFTPELLNRLQTESTFDYLELERRVEMVKRNMKPDSKGRFTLQIPMELRDMFEKKNGRSLVL
jgi:ATP-dependent Clp protease ATP-binding subunit ClpA